MRNNRSVRIKALLAVKLARQVALHTTTSRIAQFRLGIIGKGPASTTHQLPACCPYQDQGTGPSEETVEARRNLAKMASNQQDPNFLMQAYTRLQETLAHRDDGTLPTGAALSAAVASLPQSNSLAAQGTGAAKTLDHLLTDIVPALNGQALSGRYYGFVTGGSLPIAQAADNIVSALDQNVQVHLPSHSATTYVEDAALQDARVAAGARRPGQLARQDLHDRRHRQQRSRPGLRSGGRDRGPAPGRLRVQSTSSACWPRAKPPG